MTNCGSDGSGEIGNTNSISRDSPKYHFMLTINNYEEKNKETLSGSDIIELTVAQTEVGESGTKHIQAYVKTKTKCRFKTIKELFPRAHVEKVKNIQKAIEYCQKEESADGSWELFRGLHKVEKLKLITLKDLNEKQIHIVNTIKMFDGEGRKILWFLDYRGGAGKSLIAKYFYDSEEGSIVLNGGKSNDIAFCLKTYVEQKRRIKTIIFDIPRSSQEFINYAAIENVYNGLLSSNKYESCILRFNPPKRIVVMANEEPDGDKLSKDRIVLKQLKSS